MSTENWTCPHCSRHVTITPDRRSIDRHTLTIKNADGPTMLVSIFRVCPNSECLKFSLQVSLHESTIDHTGSRQPGETRQLWRLIPESQAQIFPAYIPAPLLADYREACLIETLSPKASATLSRRCLQGMLRDFWGVKAGQLNKEIEAIKEKVDAETWGAIDALRDLGNIGAHMKADINVIVDVDPNEARLLIQLVETLFRDWYIVRYERKQRMAAIASAATIKKSTSATGGPGITSDSTTQPPVESSDPSGHI